MFKNNLYYKSFKKLLKHRTFKNTSYLTIGGMFSQLISLIGAFYIPRLLGPEKYGIFQIVVSYIGIFTFLTFSGVNKIILRECSRNLDKAKEIIESIIGFKNLCAIFAIIISVIVLVFMDYDEITKIYIAIFSFTLLIKGLNSSISIIYQAYEKMKPIAYFQIFQSLLIVPLSIIFLKLGYGVLALIIIQLFTSILILIVNYKYSKKFVKFNIFSKVKIIKAYLKQGFTFSLLGFFNTLSGKIDIFMLSILTTPENVGIYALAYRIVQKGLIIRKPISASLFPYYTKKYEKEPVRIKKLIKHTMIIIIPSILIIIVVLLSSKFVITTIVGNEFIESAKILNVLICYLVVNYAVIPWGLALQTTNNEKTLFYIVIVKGALNITLNLVFYNLYGIIGIAYSTLLNESFNFLSQVVVNKKIIKQ
ncbi:MAG: flippase [Candidatus Marinimicrobia bacterium]|nr:flippase [Candidatus Neomarinimicrobiota bacterium]